MIHLVNCIFKQDFAVISIDIEKGIFANIKTYADSKFNKEKLIKQILSIDNIDYINIANKNSENKKYENEFQSIKRRINDEGLNLIDIEEYFNSDFKMQEKFNRENCFFNCKGMLILPGGIDPHVHFDTPGYDFREDFSTASASAIAGGVTTIIDMPCTSIPEVTSRKNFNEKLSIVSKMSYCDFAFFGGICGNTVDKEDFEENISDLVSCGVKGFKAYLISGMPGFPRLTNFQLLKAARVCKKVGKPLLLHAEDFETIDGYFKDHNNIKILNNIDDQDKFKNISDIKNVKNNINQRKIDLEIKAYCESRSDLAEIIAVQNAAAISEKVENKVHIVHLSSAKAVRFIEYAKSFCNISFETAPHYLQWTNDDFYKLGSLIKTAPPVKSEVDKKELRKSIENGNCLFIASDHAACKIEEKNTGSFLKDYSGIAGVQTVFQYILSEFLDKISLSRIIELTSENAAKFYGIYPKKGAILNGSDADFVLVKKNEKFIFENNMLLSKMKVTPFNNFEFNHKIYAVALRGKPAFLFGQGIKIGKGEGKYI